MRERLTHDRAPRSYQTVYSIFVTKVRLAQAMLQAGWPHVDKALKLVEDARASGDPEAWLRTMATANFARLWPSVKHYD